MRRQQSLLVLIIVLLVGAVTVLTLVPLRLGLDLQGGAQLTIQVESTDEIEDLTPEEVISGVLSVVRNRVDALGVSEPLVQTLSDDKILVQLPGVSDPEQAERVLGGTAQLEFREQQAGTDEQLQAELLARRELQLEFEVLKAGGDDAALAQKQESLETSNEAIAALFAPPLLTGKNLKFADARNSAAGSDNWSVSLEFDGEGGEKFAELTKNLAGTGRSLGIFLDGKLISSPVVSVEFAETGITGGQAVINGRFTIDEANDLAVQLRGGSLPVPVKIVENRTVGATLGQDSIRRSVLAAAGGLILVLGFMVAYYRLPGAIADISLIIYALFTLAAYAILQVTLTLPGIAGFILSIGMAVDANVLIFERTREELRAGKTLYRSVESGFYRAFSSILDSNVTTLIACLALFWLGAGLVKGFALTLAIGVGVSMFTAIACSRTLLFLALQVSQLKKPELFCPDLPGSSQS
ncbi:protein translocase subunit SecD [Oscillatoriales cyanobacterium LEGE 11467]|uniref:Protein translocase subunit SecD n=1 Tax=Zarconia navalis LEGE 11467 TaxID=1828826 RepID=A0A928VWQ1_9CYAN|nr:protein translocase subunit SecD [Zarconia navalis]MBE9041637.1 protein translocase subunit SecD [Zarconia navalis LEGE 11467]